MVQSTMLTKEMLIGLRTRYAAEYKIASRGVFCITIQDCRDGTSEGLEADCDRISAKLDLIEDLIYLFD